MTWEIQRFTAEGWERRSVNYGTEARAQTVLNGILKDPDMREDDFRIKENEESEILRVACPVCKVGHSEDLSDPWYYENEDGNATCDNCGEVFAIYWDGIEHPCTEEEWEELQFKGPYTEDEAGMFDAASDAAADDAT
jgi:ribosomal protein S27E